MASDGPSTHPPSLRLNLAAHHRDATMPSPYWAPHFMTQECVMFSNPTPSEPRLSPTATMSDDTLSALTPPLYCASILQPATPPQVVTFESWTISAPICLNRFTLAESRKPDLWTCVCVLTFFSCTCAFLIEMDFSNFASRKVTRFLQNMSFCRSRISKERMIWIEKVAFTVRWKSMHIAVFGSVRKIILSTARCLRWGWVWVFLERTRIISGI